MFKNQAFWIRWLVLWVLLAQLVACVSVRAPQGSNQFQIIPVSQRQARLQAITHWQATGAFSAKIPGQAAVIANYTWQQQAPLYYKLTLASTLNVFTLTILGNGPTVSLHGAHEAPLVAQSPEALMQQALGWSLPISDLFYWVRGLPDPQHPATSVRFDTYGHLQRLQQAGWQINYSAYRRVGGVDLPGTLQLLQAGTQVKIVIKQWSIV